jgi:hypothetical protein
MSNNVNQLQVDTGGMKLLNSTISVNDIQNVTDGDSIDSSSTDAQLATAKLIYTTITGSALWYQDDSSPYNLVAKGAVNIDTISGSSGNFIAGEGAGASLTTGGANVIIGPDAGADMNTNGSTIAIGREANRYNDTGIQIVAIGDYAGRGQSGSTTGSYGTYVGAYAGANVTTAAHNVLIGRQAGDALTTGGENVVVGSQGLTTNQTGVQNAVLGDGEMWNSGNVSNNVAIGWSAGGNAQGSNNVFIGSEAGYNEAGSNKLYIDNSNTASPLIYGDFNTNDITINGTLTVAESGNQLVIDASGMKLLNSTATVNEILNTVDADAIDASSTDDQLATAKLIYNEIQAITTGYGQVDHTLLSGLQGGNGSDEYYHLDSTDYTVLSAITSTDVSNWDSAYSHSTSFHVSSHSDLTGVAGSGDEYHVSQNVYNAMSSDGSTLTITGTVSATGDVDVDGSFSFDSGTAVDNIVTSISDPGADTNLVTEAAIFSHVDSISGTLQSQITGQNEFIELIDTPAAYAGSENYYLRVNASGTEVVFDNTVNDWMADSEEPTGFTEYKTGSTISFSGNTVTISGTYSYWIKGTKYSKSGVDQVAVSSGTEGIQHVYFDGETLSYSTSFSNDILSDYAYVANVYWDDSNNQIILFGDERHGMIMDNATHINLHNSQGTVYISGLAPSDVQADEDGSLNSHAQFGMGSGYILDEDLMHTISSVAVSGTIPVFYRAGADSGGVWRRDSQSGYAFLNATNRPYWNELSGSTWQLSEVPTGNLVLVHIFATNDADQPYISVMGQSSYADNVSARLGAAEEMNQLVLSGLPSAEYVAVATFILDVDDTFNNDVNARYITTEDGNDFYDWRRANLSSATGASANQHSQLAGLTDPNQHPASSIYTSTTNFDGALSSADDTVQKALDTLDNAIAGTGHYHYGEDLTWQGSNVWDVTDATISGSEGVVNTDNVDVYLNGLLNKNDSEYYTISVVNNTLTVTFAYNTYDSDWAHIKFWKQETS